MLSEVSPVPAQLPVPPVDRIGTYAVAPAHNPPVKANLNTMGASSWAV